MKTKEIVRKDWKETNLEFLDRLYLVCSRFGLKTDGSQLTPKDKWFEMNWTIGYLDQHFPSVPAEQWYALFRLGYALGQDTCGKSVQRQAQFDISHIPMIKQQERLATLKEVLEKAKIYKKTSRKFMGFIYYLENEVKHG